MDFHNNLELSSDVTNMAESFAKSDEQLVDKRIGIEKPVDVYGVAEFLGKKPNTVRNWVSTGRYDIPHFRLGNKSMFFLSKVAAWCRTL